MGKGPGFVVLGDDVDFQGFPLKQGAPVVLSDGEILLDDSLGIDLSPGEPFNSILILPDDPLISPEQLLENVEYLRSFIGDMAKDEARCSLARALWGGGDDPVFSHIARKVRSFWMSGAKSSLDSLGCSLKDLIGLGWGTTPSGDDHLLGVLAVSHALKALPRLKGVLSPGAVFVCDQLPGLAGKYLENTSYISASFLRYGLEGRFTGSVAELIEGLFFHNIKRKRPVLEKLLGFGASSGIDLMTGVIGAVSPRLLC